MSDNPNEMKYEGLAALMITLDQNHGKRFNDFKSYMDGRFDVLEDHNKKQNGSISKTRDDIIEIKDELQKRELTCMADVSILKQNMKYGKFLMWLDKRWKLALVLFIFTLIITGAIVQAAADGGWLVRIYELIK